MRGGRARCEGDPGGLFLRAFVAFGRVLDEFDWFSVTPIDHGCNAHCELGDLGSLLSVLDKIWHPVREMGLKGIAAV